MSDAISLNPEQELAANHTTGPCLVTAAPGSGKTRVIVERTARLIQGGVEPRQILSITFTNKAAAEMKQRLFARLGDSAKKLTMCTIHAWCAGCLRRYGHMIGFGPNMVILDEDDQVSLLAQIARQLLPPQNDEETDKSMNRKVLRKLAGKMDDCREKLLDDEEMQKVLDKEDYNWYPIVQEYLKQLQPKDRVDFSGLLCEVVRLLQTQPAALKAIQDRFKYIQVDEVQDTNRAQFEIIRLIGSETKNIFIVGDVDQCQPEGSLVMTSDKKFKPIEELQPDKETLTSWDRSGAYAVGWKSGHNFVNNGYRFSVAKRTYTGNMYTIIVNGEKARCTDKHRWPVRMDRQTRPESELWVVYLMQQGSRFRIGQCSFYGLRKFGFNFGVRCRMERAENAWVLSVHKSKKEAIACEETTAIKYGLPTICFEEHSPGYDRQIIDRIFASLDINEQHERAVKCLQAFGRDPLVPFFVKGKFTENGHRCSREVAACNLLPIVMQIPVNLYAAGLSHNPKICQWKEIESVDFEFVKDEQVYSLDVEKHHKYITNGGLVTCNSIYRFRGAAPENIDEFVTEYKPRIIRLGQNYRSTPQIVAVANALIRRNPGRLADDFRTSNQDGKAVVCRRMFNSDDESKWIAEQVRQTITSGIPPQRIAVLYRLNKMSRSIEQAMRFQRIPYMVVGGFSFYDRSEVKDHLSMLRLLFNPADNLAFQRIANKPLRSLGDAAVSKLEKFAADNQLGILEACQRANECLKTATAIKGAKEIASAYGFEWRSKPLTEVIQMLSDRLRYQDHLRHDEDREKLADKNDNVKELIISATPFGIAEKGLSNFLDQVTLLTSVDKAEKKNNAVTLSTIHQAKGREWHTVFIPGVEQGTIPHSRATEEDPEGIFEERRTFYVALTRAEKDLRVTYCAQRQDIRATSQRGGVPQWYPCQPSQFLSEAGLIKAP